jgi:tRNA(Ile)-lysidine synthase
MADRMGQGDTLLTAHQQDDQAETVLLQLLRGAGPRGLAAMPSVARFGPGYRARPLLGFSRRQLQAYAEKHRLDWIEDASNQDTGFDRNYLRRRILPLLRDRWPSLGHTISRSAHHCAESQLLVDEMADRDLEQMLDAKDQTIPVSGLRVLSPPRARALLRTWIGRAGFPLPDSARLERLLGEMTGAGRDRNPLVRWPGVEARRYRDRLFLMSPLPRLDPGLTIDWDTDSPLSLPAGLGRLVADKGVAGISRSLWMGRRIQIRFRHQGERLSLPGRIHTQSFKNFFQQHAIPPWQRSRIPLIYLDGDLASVADLCVCAPFQSPQGEAGVCIRWERNTPA